MSVESRIGDVEREAAVTALGEHYAAGRLTKEEYDERAEAAFAARTESQLRPLFIDLPLPHGGRPVAPAPRRSTVPPPRRPRPPARFPLLPVLLIVVGLVVLTGAPWLLFLLIGLLFWCRGPRRSCGR